MSKKLKGLGWHKIRKIRTCFTRATLSVGSVMISSREPRSDAGNPTALAMWSVIGQDHLLRQLDASLQAGRVGHAYLLTGPPHVGKMTLALDMAAAVNCHAVSGLQSGLMFDDGMAEAGPCGQCEPCGRIRRGVYADLNVVAVGGDARVTTRISIEQVREAENFLSVTPVEGAWKVVIFDGAETLSAGQSESANALLKTLEEPPEHVLILLLTTNEDAILPTIRSRCRVLSLRPMPGAALADNLATRYNAPTDTGRWLARLSRGCPGWAISALTDPAVLEERNAELDRIAATAVAPLDARFAYANSLAGSFSGNREAVRQSLYLWQRWWRDVLLVKEGATGHVHNSDRAEELERQAAGADTVAIVAFLRSVQETLTALDANANPRLALECMMLAVPA